MRTTKLEYLKALKRQNSPIIPVTIKREGAAYNDDEIPVSSRFVKALSLAFGKETPLESSCVNKVLYSGGSLVKTSVTSCMKTLLLALLKF